MGNKAEYKSAIRSRKLIRQAYVDLIKENPNEKISVTDIITRADINRGTFYAHYEDIHALVEEIQNEIIEKMLKFISEFHYKKFFNDPMPLLLKISKWLEEEVSMYRVLINAKGSDDFFRKLRNIFIDQMETDSDIPMFIKGTPQFYIYAHFLAGGIINLYQIWLRGEIDESLQEISLVVSNILKNVVKEQ